MHSGLCNKAHNVPPGPRRLLHSCTTMVPSLHRHVIRFHDKRCGMCTSRVMSLALPHGFPIRWVSLGISFAVLDNPEPLYLLELLGQTAFFGTPWGTQEYPRYRFNWLNTQHVSDAEEKVMRIKTGGCASFDPTETRVEPF